MVAKKLVSHFVYSPSMNNCYNDHSANNYYYNNDCNNEPALIEGAVFVAYVVGKLSYQSTCQQKILQKIPNSNLAQSVRKSRGMATLSDRLVQ